MARISYEKDYKIIGVFWSILVITILVLTSGLRSGIGDTSAYKHSFDLLVQDPTSFRLEGDFALGLLSLLLMKISTDPQILIFTTALITNLFNVAVFNKYRSYLELQVYMYITSGYYIVTMNGIRQCLAAAIIFICTKLIIEGKFKTYCICILFIATIHGSAIIMIPLYFIVRQEAWSKKMLILMILASLGVLLYEVISPIIFKALENTQYAHYSEFDEGGSSVMRTIVNAVPVILAYLKRKELKEKWNNSNIFVNISIINLVFVAFGMFNWIFNRFTIYFQLYNFILIPYILKNCTEGKEKRLFYFGFIVCYFIFFYREQVMGMNLIYHSDYNIFDFYNNTKGLLMTLR
ncbi:MAG: EpsG family protein [Romboutsia sp.]